MTRLRLPALCASLTTALCASLTTALCASLTTALCASLTTALCASLTTALGASLHTAAAAPLPAPVQDSPAAEAKDYRADIEALWRIVDESYAYRDELGDDWTRARAGALEAAAACRDASDFLALVERLLALVADHHAHLGVNGPQSPPLVPSGTDIWAQWKDEVAVIVAVRGGSPAASAGVPVGSVVHALDGLDLVAAGERLSGRSWRELGARQRDWALRVVLAGERGRARHITLEPRGEAPTTLTVPAPQPAGPPAGGPLVEARRLADDLGYVRFLDALGDPACVAEFDEALATLRDARGLVLDLRDTPSGGNTSVARGILSRFVAEERPYQRHVRPQEERDTGIARAWLELVAPRGPFRYEGPVVVLVGRWTASMGEGLAIGFDALGATVVGGRMAGLRGAIESFTLPASGFALRLPVERLSHVDGRPRERFFGEPVHPLASPEQVLETGLARLSALVNGTDGR